MTYLNTPLLEKRKEGLVAMAEKEVKEHLYLEVQAEVLRQELHSLQSGETA